MPYADFYDMGMMQRVLTLDITLNKTDFYLRSKIHEAWDERKENTGNLVK